MNAKANKTDLLAEFAALVIECSSSVDRSATAHELLDAGMTKAQVMAFEFAIMDAYEVAIMDAHEVATK